MGRGREKIREKFRIVRNGASILPAFPCNFWPVFQYANLNRIEKQKNAFKSHSDKALKNAQKLQLHFPKMENKEQKSHKNAPRCLHPFSRPFFGSGQTISLLEK